MQKALNSQNEKELKNPYLDPPTTTACMEGVKAAYELYNKPYFVLPTGFQALGAFTGWDAYFYHFAQEEKFGIVFRSVADPSTLLIAIRGTSSILDAYEDLWANWVSFRPINPVAPFPSDVYIASGFNSVYTGNGNTMTDSMQHQIFALIAKSSMQNTVKKVIVTGHSLGAGLCSLLALDIAASIPDIDVYNYNFASPRIGSQEWKSTYEKKFDLESRTFRIANYYDFVPTLPPEFLGYDHVGMKFLIAFYVENALFPHPVSRHSMNNYQVVLNHAIYQDPQGWQGTFHDGSSLDSTYTMVSVDPPSSDVPEWSVAFREAEKRSIEALSLEVVIDDSKTSTSKNLTLMGRVVGTDKNSVAGVVVEAWDKDRFAKDDALGSAVTKADGSFSITVEKKEHKKWLFDNNPDVYFRVQRGGNVLHSTKDKVMWNVKNPQPILIQL